MAAVSQNPVLFSGSVKYNIAYGLRDCTIEQVKEAAEKANAHEFICKMDEGYDTGKNFTYLKKYLVDFTLGVTLVMLLCCRCWRVWKKSILRSETVYCYSQSVNPKSKNPYFG